MDNNKSAITSPIVEAINPNTPSTNAINSSKKPLIKSYTGSFFNKLTTFIIIFGVLIVIFVLYLFATKGTNKQQDVIIPQNDGSTKDFDFFKSNNKNDGSTINNKISQANNSQQTILPLPNKRPFEDILPENPTSVPEDLSSFLKDFGKKNYQVYTNGSINDNGVLMTFSDKKYYFAQGQLVVTTESLSDGGTEKTILTKNNELYTIQDTTRQLYLIAGGNRSQSKFMSFSDWRNSHPLAIMYYELSKKKMVAQRDKYGMYDIEFPLKYIDVAYPKKQSAKVLIDLKNKMVKYLLLYRFNEGEIRPYFLGKIKFSYKEISNADLDKLRILPTGYNRNYPIK